MSAVNWVKTHKLVSLLILVVVFLLGRELLSSSVGVNTSSTSLPQSTSSTVGLGKSSSNYSTTTSNTAESTSSTTSKERMVIKNSGLSLLVKDVRTQADSALSYAKRIGGYMVDSSYSRPNESPYATLTVRVPTTKLDEALAYFRSLAIKVSSESLVGEDVTDQYTDTTARIATEEQTKAMYEALLKKATTVSDIASIQEKIIYTQEQIDALKGDQKALEQNAALTKVTLYLSTDELALPYTPDTAFRPTVIFKQATRSLLNSLRIGGEALIWIIVYGIVWVPPIVIFIGYKRWRKRRNLQA